MLRLSPEFVHFGRDRRVRFGSIRFDRIGKLDCDTGEESVSMQRQRICLNVWMGVWNMARTYCWCGLSAEMIEEAHPCLTVGFVNRKAVAEHIKILQGAHYAPSESMTRKNREVWCILWNLLNFRAFWFWIIWKDRTQTWWRWFGGGSRNVWSAVGFRLMWYLVDL